MALSAEKLAEMQAHLASSQQEATKAPSLLESLFHPSGKMAAVLPAGFEATGKLGAAGLAALFGGKKSSGEFVEDAKRSLTRKRNFGPGGKIRPLGVNQKTGEALGPADLAKDTVGTALEIGSYVPIGGGVAKIGQVGLKGLLKEGVRAGVVAGGVGGAMQAGGSELQDPDSTVGSVAANATLGGIAGAATGAVIGGAVPLTGAGLRKVGGALVDNPLTRTLRAGVNKVGSMLPDGKAVAGELPPTPAARVARTLGRAADVVGEYGRKVGTAIKNAPERLATNADAMKLEREALESLDTGVRGAVENGVKVRDAQMLVEEVAPAQRSFYRKMLDAARDFSADRGTTDPAEVMGGAVRESINSLQDILDEQGSKLASLARGLGGETVENAGDDVLTKMKGVRGLEDLAVDEKGVLDFSKTTLSTKLTEADRKAIQRAFSSIKGRDALGLHRLRQELFKWLDGQKKSLLTLNETSDLAVQAIRQGLADAIEKLPSATEYKALNQANAKLLDPLMNLNKFYKELEGATDDIFDAESGRLVRRLTSNAQSGTRLRKIFQQMDTQLKEYGKDTGVDIHRLQDFYNALSRYYDIAKDTSLAGQVKLVAQDATPGSVVSKVAGAVQDAAGQTPAVARRAFEELFEAFEKHADSFADDAVDATAGVADDIAPVADNTIRSAMMDIPPMNEPPKTTPPQPTPKKPKRGPKRKGRR